MKILQTLILVRYVKDVLKPNIDNLIALCIKEVDTDRIVLKKNIEASLERLEKQNLINRNDDLYFFLTNEEQDVLREIKRIDILSSAKIELLGEIIFDDVLKKKNKHRYAAYKRDYQFNRICDGRYCGRESKGELGLEIISPLHDDYPMFSPAKCNMYSANQDDFIIVKLPDDTKFIEEIRIYLQTGKYIKDKIDAAASVNLKAILRDMTEQNRERRTRLITLIEKSVVDAEYFSLGRSIEIKTQNFSKAIEEAFDYLIKNIFSKFKYLPKIYNDPIEEIKQTLRADDITQQQLMFDFASKESQDIKEVKSYIDLQLRHDLHVILNQLVKYFDKKPYGWDKFQTIVIVARLFMAGNISLVMDSSKLQPKDAFAPLSKTHQWKNVQVQIITSQYSMIILSCFHQQSKTSKRIRQPYGGYSNHTF